MAFHPYLNFGGNCREAFTRYHEIFGGELIILAMADMPSEEPVPAGMEDLVMHAALTFENGDLLMASDDPTSDPFGPVQGMHVNYTTSDLEHARRVFDQLAEGGTITMPIGETFWAPLFGMCIDRFGTPWMVNAEPPAQG